MQAARRDASGRLYEYSQEQVLGIVTYSHVPQTRSSIKERQRFSIFHIRTTLFLLPKHDRFSDLVGLNRCYRQR